MNRDKTFRAALATLALGAVVALAACEAATAPEAQDVTTEDAEAIAGFLSDLDVLALGALSATTSGTRSFSRSAPCPAGGSVSVTGTGESSTDTATRVVSTRWSNTKVQAACAVTHTRGDKSVTVVVDGSVTSAGTSTYQLPANKGEGRTLLAWSSTTVGSTTTKVGDKTSTCVVDLKQTWDAAAQKFVLSGTMCGRTVDTSKGR